MYTWIVNYKDYQNNVKKNFKVKADSKQKAIEKATKKCFNDRNLNNYNIQLDYNF